MRNLAAWEDGVKRETGFHVQNSSPSKGGEKCDWTSLAGLLKEIREAQRSEDFLERVAMELLMLRLEESVLSPGGDEVRVDWGWEPPNGLH